MKRTELEKRKGLKISNEMRRVGNPYTRGESAQDRRAQREADRAQGLVPFAVKLPQDLVRRMQQEAATRGARLDELVAEWLRRGLSD